ncbi:MAG TPA: hypothetical protein VMT35_17055 [Ignavibacteriaceae bacterium]|nr:hypothetical protein [Ignavibacteriaceae bacterium]
MNGDLHQLLKAELAKAEKAAARLKISFDKCTIIGKKKTYNDDELGLFESLTSRFARMSDILIKKIFRLIEKIDLDDNKTIRDSIFLAEKKGLINNSDSFIKIRELRNFTAHEYEDEELYPVFSEMLKLTPSLFDSLARIKNYSRKYNL